MPVSKDVPGEWDDGPRTTAWVFTGIAGATLAATVGWYFYRDHYTHVNKPAHDGCIPELVNGKDIHNCAALQTAETSRQLHKQDIWNGVELGLGLATGATVLVAAYMWSRHYTPSHRIMVTPTANGGTVSLGGDF